MRKVFYFAVVSLLLATSASLAQSTASISKKPPEIVSPASNRGFTWYTSATGSHDSISGWSSIIESSVRYDFNNKFGVELGVPYYIVHSGYDSTKVVGINKTPALVSSYNSLGDTALTLHFAAPGSWVGYRSTLAGTAPTGDTSSGISTGRATFDLNNHFEHSWGRITPFAELGIGDSSALVNKAVKHPYTTLGPLSHYKAGSYFSVLKVFSFEISGYEDLPIGDQKIYSHLFRASKNGTIVRVVNGKKRRFQSVQVDTGQGILEDNGLTNSLTISLGPHIALTGTYQRSLRQSFDTASFGVAYSFGRRAAATANY